MDEIKTPREAKGMNQLKGIPTTYRYSSRNIIPMRTHANLHHCHSLRCARDVARIDRKLWEPKVSELLNDVEKQRLISNNRFYKTLGQIKELLNDSYKREEKLQATKEEMEASNEELEATNEELQATTEELEIVNKNRKIIIDSMRDILMTTDLSGMITEVNKATEHISGYSSEKLIGQPFRQFFADPEKAQAGIEMAAREEDVSNYDLTMVAKDGHEMEVSYSAVVLRDSEGRTSGVLGSARDITTRKRTEMKLQAMSEKMEAANEELEQRIDELSRVNGELQREITKRIQAEEEIESYAAKLENANKELETFAYSVSHDLRTPVRAIDGFSRILIEDHTEKLDDEGRRVLNVIRSNTVRMGQLIDDILSFSRLGRIEMNVLDIDMEKLAGNVVNELKPTVNDRNVELIIDTLPPSQGDEAMIRVVMVNLINNAIKFTRPRTAARIEIGGRSEDNENIYFVRDNGVGFDMNYQNKLFGVFQRLHSQDEFEGTGIGLALVKQVITRHGGRVWAEGKVDEGAVIHFTLPQKKEQKNERR